MSERTYEFHWDIIGDLQAGRPNLGDQVHLILYRVMLCTLREVVLKKFGNEEGNNVFRNAGNIAGRFFFEHFLRDSKDLSPDEFLRKFWHVACQENGLRFLRIDSVDVDGEGFSLSVATGMETTGFDRVKIDDCNYDIGLVEGVLFKYTGKVFKVKTVNTDAVQDIMPNISDQISLIPYRMLQYTVRDVIEQKAGTEMCDQIYYEAGEVAGDFFFDKFLVEFKELPLNGFVAELQRVLKDLGVGILRVEKADPEKGEFTLTVSEDLDCSGLPDLGIEVCNYDEGFIAGIFYKYTGVIFKAKEVDCWCSGDRTCRFAVNRAAGLERVV